VTNGIATNEEEFTDDGWEEFLALPMNDSLGDFRDVGMRQQSGDGFGERYKLALTFVKLLAVVGVVAVGATAMWALRGSDGVTIGTVADGVSVDTPVVCEPIDLRNAMAIPERIACDNGALIASGDLDGGWNGRLSGWQVPDSMVVAGLWQNWDDGTPDPSGFEAWTGTNAHADTDPADNRYQEIRIMRIAPGEFSIFENRGLTGRSVTFTFVPTDAAPEEEAAARTPTGPQQFSLTDGRAIAVQSAARTSIIWDGRQTTADRTVDWEVEDDLESATVLVGSLIEENTIESIRGTMDLEPGSDGTEVNMSGGLFVRVYQSSELGIAGGKSAQLGLVNTSMGPIVDRTSGICPHESCTVRNSAEYATAESVDLDATDGLGFEITAKDEFMTMRLWSIAQPGRGDAVVTQPWTGAIGAASIEIWATDWSFAGQVDDIVVSWSDDTQP